MARRWAAVPLWRPRSTIDASPVYESNESGQEEIYVRPFPDVDSALHPVSTSGGSRPL